MKAKQSQLYHLLVFAGYVWSFFFRITPAPMILMERTGLAAAWQLWLCKPSKKLASGFPQTFAAINVDRSIALCIDLQSI